MNWADPDGDDRRVILAILRIPATDLEDYKGPVFLNPGVRSPLIKQ